MYAFGARVQEAPAPGVNLSSANTRVTASGYETTDAALVAAAAARGADAIDARDVELLYTSAGAQWQESRARVAAWAPLNASALAITMVQPGWALVRGKPYIESLPTALLGALPPRALAPGQGVVSASSQTVTFRPRGGAMTGASAWAAAIDGELLLINSASRIRVENVSFRGATWLAPTTEGAYAPDQGGIIYRAADLAGGARLAAHAMHAVPAAVTVRGSTHVTLAGVAVAQVGGTGIAVEGGSSDVLLARVRVTDAGCSGVRLGEVADADAPNATDTRLTLEDSTLEGLAQVYRDCSGVFGGFVTASVIAHNAINNTNWAGLTLGWLGWGGCPYRPALGGNTIANNTISNVNLVTGDGGPIYVMGQGPTSAACGADDLSCRSVIAGNYVSYALHHAAMLYHDEGSAFYYTHDNVVLQPLLKDPHGWWWSWAAAWADTESNILITRNYAVGVNRSDCAEGHNLVIKNNTLLPWGSAWPPAAQAIIDAAGPRV